MKTTLLHSFISSFEASKFGYTAALLRVGRVMTLFLPLGLLLVVPARAQFVYTNTGVSITITGYNGPGGAVTIPELIDGLPVTGLADWAIPGCDNAVTLWIPATLTNFMQYAILACTNLVATTVASANPALSSLDGVLFDRNRVRLIAYPPLKAGDAYAIPESVKTIGFNAFGGGPSLTSILIPNGVNALESFAFGGVPGLQTIALPDSITDIGDYCFIGCAALTTITLPGSIKSMGSQVFMDCSALTNAVLADGVSSLGTGLFYECTNLSEVTIPGSVGNIGNSTFHRCLSLRSIALPEGVNRISGSAFYYCQNLTNVTLPTTLKSIGTCAFQFCLGLTSLRIPEGVTNIGSMAFWSCAWLTQLVLPNSLTTLGDHSLAACTGLTSLTIPSGVTNIGNSALAYCPKLTQVYFRGNAPAVASSAFDDDTATVVFYLPGTTGWESIFCGLPAMLWDPRVLFDDGNFGVQANVFGFTIAGPIEQSIVVEACNDLLHPVWSPVQTNRLIDGSAYFSDDQWTNYPGRLYRLRSP